MKSNKCDDNRAAIVCSHVAIDGFCILYAKRDEPIQDEDSGWQFLCYSGKDEDDEKAKVWAVSEVVAHEPSLLPFIDAPIGTKLTRRNFKSDWQVAP